MIDIKSVSRWKCYNSIHTPKFMWRGKSSLVKYYFPMGTSLTEEIAKDQGILYVANGEPSVLSFLAAGIVNYCIVQRQQIVVGISMDLLTFF